MALVARILKPMGIADIRGNGHLLMPGNLTSSRVVHS
jgi:hypothetical protein